VDSLNLSQENSLYDDTQMDDDDLMDQGDLIGKSQHEEESEAVYNMLHLIGIHEAILMSIDRCGMFGCRDTFFDCEYVGITYLQRIQSL